MLDSLKPYAKALVPLALIVLALLGNALGVDTGISIEAQITLLVAALGVYAVPNANNTTDE